MVNASRWDASEYIDNERDAIAYLNAAAELDDPALLQAAIGDVAKARGMGQIAKEAGVGRESLYKSLDRSGNPSFRTISKVVGALGGRLVIEPVQARGVPPAGVSS
ncbi:addiction module antidote protein [Bifidobacterium panos]|uniref:Addiction module antitoxin n=1 Tax=Bifidobacterium panos TaxID=2675321 RepID=A0ABX1T0X3_9BIFI|nr:addiction module antidote protein [Bifidobacterium sp. DSM 109963]NMN02459.1 addiction module antitoxin [Bifidobacterium sp. DSM 109963]